MNDLTKAIEGTPIILNGKPLSFADIALIGARKTHLLADRAAMERVRRAREVIEEAIATASRSMARPPASAR